jgi:hypothetical protein
MWPSAREQLVVHRPRSCVSCHRNVIPVAANRRKLRQKGEKREGKCLAPDCRNLLIPFAWRQFRQDLVRLVARLLSRGSGVRIPPGAPLTQFCFQRLPSILLRPNRTQPNKLALTVRNFQPCLFRFDEGRNSRPNWGLPADLERHTSREPAHLTSSRAMVIKPVLAMEIGENPCCSGNSEGLGVFAPIRIIVGIRNKQRYPHE